MMAQDKGKHLGWHLSNDYSWAMLSESRKNCFHSHLESRGMVIAVGVAWLFPHALFPLYTHKICCLLLDMVPYNS